jgi:branched-chain amino acid transport system permease protein
MSNSPRQVGSDLIAVRRSTHSSTLTLIGAIVMIGVLTGAPWIFPASFVTILMNFFILVSMATMWNLMAGYAGMVSIGQQAFVGLGGYATLYFALKGMSPYVAIPFSALTTGIIAIPITYLLFRLRGGYFSIATWVIADTAGIIIGTIALFGGGTGRPVPGFTNFSPTQIANNAYLACWLVALAVIAGTYFLLRSRLGLVLSSIRDNEISARSSGVKVTSSRRLVFIIAAAGCGAAGAVLAIAQPYVQVSNEFNIQWAAEMLFVSMIGGLGTIEGPIVGCVIFFALQQTLQSYGAWYLIIFGSLAVIVAIWQPRGLWGAFRDKFHIELLPVGYWTRSKKKSTSTPEQN